ncbi:MAG: hypothetical protein M0R47_16970 [Methylobacter sp.]|uniref:hypothetical protein n=1 Tax=Methylobacter sp. TaxID=2051955 RepID=UPI0025F334D0|nr:hypothetical protein [Methylobacter sp.]MCK9622216.1 hypothetical protein [Methylobacter sp.]
MSILINYLRHNSDALRELDKAFSHALDTGAQLRTPTRVNIRISIDPMKNGTPDHIITRATTSTDHLIPQGD